MCGIVGFIGQGDLPTLKKMCDRLVHRGPDQEGLYSDPTNAVFLGHRRLSIIDLQHGQQPMWDNAQQIGVIFNGEIYNHAELRQQLIKQGHVFKTDHSDTEVLIHGYKQWGEQLPLHLNGMFAFAIYDKYRGKIFLARDRFGEKPLYYATQGELFVFASELKAFFTHPNYQATVNKLNLKKYFAYGFLPAPHSPYHDTYKLPAGYALTFDIRSKKINQQPYWQFRIEPQDHYLQRSEDDLCEELLHLLSQAVKRRLVSDVPLGIFLSGGIDSSAITALAAQHIPAKQIQTFTIGFTEPSFDESEYARFLANHIGTQHRESTLKMSRCKELITPILSQLDDLLADASIIPTYLVSQFARQFVTVALGGDGGDELFAGYDPFKALKLANSYRKLVPKFLHNGLRRLVNMLPVSTQNMSLDFKLKRTLSGLTYDPKLWNPIWLAPAQPQELEELFNEPVDLSEIYSEAIAWWETSPQKNMIDKTMEFYTQFYLPDDILMKVDRASMMVSLESRAPFLDPDVVEFARQLPAQFKYRHGQTKYLLKKALHRLLPKEILQRRKKGFGIPLNAWLREMPIPHITAIANSQPDFVAHYWQQHHDKKADHRLFLWAWLVAEFQFKKMTGETAYTIHPGIDLTTILPTL